ncbi:MAG: PAS domain-containing protein, partial [Desulfoplanes sp.]
MIHHCVALCNDSCLKIWVYTLDGTTLYVSPAFTQTTGYCLEDFPDISIGLGKLSYSLPANNEIVAGLDQGVIQNDVPIRCKNGACKHVEMFGLAYGKHVKIVVVHEVRSYTEVIDALVYSQKLLSLKSRISELFLTGGDRGVYDRVLDVLLDGMQSSAGKISFMDDTQNLLCLAFALGDDACRGDACKGDISEHSLTRSQWESGIWKRIIEEQKTCARNRPIPKSENNVSLNRIIHAPMVVSGRVLGIITVANKKEDYTAQDKTLFTSLAKHIAPILLARMEKDNEEKRRKAIEYDLNELNRELEHRVSVRSAALVKSNEMLRQEIRERRQVEASLRESEERYCLAVQGTNDGIWEWDIRRNTVYFSPRWKAIIGYQDNELPNRLDSWTSRIHPDDCERVLKTNYDCIASGDVFELEYRLRHKDGTYRWINDRGACLRDATGKAMRVAGAHADISERKKAAREKKELEKQLSHTSKLEALGTLTGGVAHDFNNLLQAMSSNIQLLHMHEGLNGTINRCVRDLDAITNRAMDLVAHLLAFSHRVDPEFKLVDINDTITNSLQLLYSTLPKMIRIEKDLDPESGLIMADASQIEQILLNLVTNARDAITGEGEICIETKSHVLGKEQAASLDLDPGRYVRLRVTDTGCGIDDQIREHIFEPFFTTKEIGQGTGLGLASVYGIVRRHCGTIICVPGIPRGTRFELFFPVQSSEENTDAEAP